MLIINALSLFLSSLLHAPAQKTESGQGGLSEIADFRIGPRLGFIGGQAFFYPSP
jgi:hypothetical protein